MGVFDDKDCERYADVNDHDRKTIAELRADIARVTAQRDAALGTMTDHGATIANAYTVMQRAGMTTAPIPLSAAVEAIIARADAAERDLDAEKARADGILEQLRDTQEYANTNTIDLPGRRISTTYADDGTGHVRTNRVCDEGVENHDGEPTREDVLWLAGAEHVERDLAAANSSKDRAYNERDRCVAMACKMAHALGLRVGLGRHDEADAAWERDWMNIVFIDLPTGQVSWHVHDSEMPLFKWMPPYPDPWDGHTTDAKYHRAAMWDAWFPTLATARADAGALRGVLERVKSHVDYGHLGTCAWAEARDDREGCDCTCGADTISSDIDAAPSGNAGRTFAERLASLEAMLDRIAAVPSIEFDPRQEECIADGVDALADALHDAEARLEAAETVCEAAVAYSAECECPVQEPGMHRQAHEDLRAALAAWKQGTR